MACSSPTAKGVSFQAAPALGPDDIEAVQAAIRHRIRRAFQRRGWLERDNRCEMEQWHHGGGFLLDAAVVINGGDRRGRERVLRYCARKARDLWTVLLARICEAFPLTCPHCSGQMRIIAFVTDPASIHAIVAHIGEPRSPPALAPARDPPAWAGEIDPELEPTGFDALAQPEPAYIFDQRITW